MEDTKDLLPDIRWLLLQHTCNADRRSDSVPQNTRQAHRSRHPSAVAMSSRSAATSRPASKVRR